MAFKLSLAAVITNLAAMRLTSTRKGQAIYVKGEIAWSEIVAQAQSPLANDCIGIAVVPKGHRLVDVIMANDEMDAHAVDTLRFSGGLLNDAKTDLQAGFGLIAAGKQAEVAKVIRADDPAGLTATTWSAGVNVYDADRIFAIKASAVVATAPTTTNKFRATLVCVPV